MKKVVLATMGLMCLLMVGKVQADCSGTIFSDVNEASVGYQFCDYIERFSVLGITTGYADGTYRPDNTVNRKQMAAFLMRAIDNVVKPKGPIPNFEGDVCWSGHATEDKYGATDITFLIKSWVKYIGNQNYLSDSVTRCGVQEGWLPLRAL